MVAKAYNAVHPVFFSRRGAPARSVNEGHSHQYECVVAEGLAANGAGYPKLGTFGEITNSRSGPPRCIWHLRDSDTLSLTDFASNRDDQSLFSGAVHATHLLVCVVPAGGFNRAKTNPLYAAALVLLVRQYLGALDKRCQISGYAAFRDTYESDQPHTHTQEQKS